MDVNFLRAWQHHGVKASKKLIAIISTKYKIKVMFIYQNNLRGQWILNVDIKCINISDFFALIMKSWNGLPNLNLKFSSRFEIGRANSWELSHKSDIKFTKEMNKAHERVSRSGLGWTSSKRAEPWLLFFDGSRIKKLTSPLGNSKILSSS